MRTVFAGIAAVMLAVVAASAVAQSYPSRLIRLIVPFPPGGAVDLLGRGVAQQLGEQTGQSVVVDNRGGAAGIIGSDALAKAAADGYTIGVIPDVLFSIYPHIYAKLPYSAGEFAPVTLAITLDMALFAHPSVAASTLQEIIALAKTKPDLFSFGTPGTGSPMHLAGELINKMAGIRMVHVPYKGGGPATADAIAGQIPLLIAGLAPALPQVKAGKLKTIAVLDSRRSALAPEVPTMAEAGLAGFQVSSWIGFFAPSGTPPEILERLNQEIVKALNSPALNSRLVSSGMAVVGSTRAALAARIRDDSDVWVRVIREAGVRLEQ